MYTAFITPGRNSTCGKRLAYLMPARQPKKDGVIFIAIKTKKAVTLSSLLPCVYDSYLFAYGRPGSPFYGARRKALECILSILDSLTEIKRPINISRSATRPATRMSRIPFTYGAKPFILQQKKTNSVKDIGKKQIGADTQIHQNFFQLSLRYLTKSIIQIVHKMIGSHSFKKNGLRS